MDAGGAQMETKMKEFRGHFATPLPGALQGRVRGGFWMDLGTILEGFLKDFGQFWDEFE